MFKRNLHLMGLMALAYACLLTYTGFKSIDLLVALMVLLIFLRKGGCLSVQQLIGLGCLLLMLNGTGQLYEERCKQYWQSVQALEKVQIQVTGIVQNENPFKPDRTTLSIEKVNVLGSVAEGSASTWAWLQGRKMIVQVPMSSAFATHGGQLVQVTIKPRLAQRAGNPGFFDYRLYLALSDTWLTAYAEEKDLKWGKVVSPLLAQREKLIGLIKERMDRVNVPESIGPSIGMLLGFDDYMSENSVADYYVAGTVHVLTVSGFHFALVYAVLNGLLKKLPLPYLLRQLLSVAFVLFFLLLTGIKFAPYRAGASMIIMLAAASLERRFDLATAASAIILPEILVNPYKAADMSLVLSYLACLAITHGAWFIKRLILFEKYKEHWQKLVSPLVFLTAVQMMLFLPIVSANNLINWVAVPSNLLGTAISGYMLLLNAGLVLMNLQGAWWCSFFSHVNGVGFLMMDLVNRLYKLCPNSILFCGDPGSWVKVGYGLILTLTVLRANVSFSQREGQSKPWLLAAMLLIIAALLHHNWKESQEIKLYFLDAGQGDSLLVRTPKGRLIAFDTGTEKMDFQQAVLNLGSQRLESLYLTHGHLDHAGGMASLKGKVRVETLAMGPNTVFEGVAPCSKRRILVGGEVDNWDGVKVRSFIDTTGAGDDPNESGVVYWLNYGKLDVLITGDAGETRQKSAMDQIRSMGGLVEVLKVAHHGSLKSNPVQLVELLKPKMAVVSVGRNFYGHPAEPVLKGLEEGGAVVLRTDERGCIVVESDGGDVRYSSFKKGWWSLKSCAQ